ncbi:MAG: hypothetical protein ACLPQ4_04135 [Thermoplasmata archaeon]
MAQKGKEELIAKFYSNFFESALRSVFLNDKQIRLTYLEKPASARNAIEDEIRHRARLLGTRLAARLAERGFLDKEPPPQVLAQLVRETLQEVED